MYKIIIFVFAVLAINGFAKGNTFILEPQSENGPYDDFSILSFHNYTIRTLGLTCPIELSLHKILNCNYTIGVTSQSYKDYEVLFDHQKLEAINDTIVIDTEGRTENFCHFRCILESEELSEFFLPITILAGDVSSDNEKIKISFKAYNDCKNIKYFLKNDTCIVLKGEIDAGSIVYKNTVRHLILNMKGLGDGKYTLLIRGETFPHYSVNRENYLILYYKI